MIKPQLRPGRINGLPMGTAGVGFEVGYPKATLALIIVNVVTYVLTSLNNLLTSIGDYWLEVGGYAPLLLIEDPQNIYRVFTSMFLHADILHIFFNMYFLYVFGKAVEGALGSTRFLLLYITSGIAASVFHTAFSYLQGITSMLVPAIGASVAISGVLGAYLMLYPGTSLTACWFFFIFPMCFTVRAAYWLLFWFATQVFYGYARLGTAVAFFAHAGGFVAGIALLPVVINSARHEALRMWGRYGSLFNVIFRGLNNLSRGLGTASKAVLAALIASLAAGSAYMLADVSQDSGFYVMDVSAKVNGLQELSYSVPVTVVNGGVELQPIPDTYVRILMNRLQGLDLIFSKALASNVVELAGVERGSKLSVGYDVIEVPTYIEYFKATYDNVGLLMSAYGKLRTYVVSIRGTWYTFSESVYYEFNIRTSGRYEVSGLIQPTALASAAISLAALLVTVLKDRDLAIIS